MEIFFRGSDEVGLFELKRDPIFGRISSEMYSTLTEFGWQTGISAANECSNNCETIIPSQIAEKLKISVLSKNWEKGSGDVRLYSEYEDKFGRITIYPNVISEDLNQAFSKGFTDLKSYAAAREFFLSHEIYHYLECRKLGLTSRKMKVTTFHFGPVKISSGVRSLSEIAADSFARTLYDLNDQYRKLED